MKCSGGWEADWKVNLRDFPETKGLWIAQNEEILLFHSHMTASYSVLFVKCFEHIQR